MVPPQGFLGVITTGRVPGAVFGRGAKHVPEMGQHKN